MSAVIPVYGQRKRCLWMWGLAVNPRGCLFVNTDSTGPLFVFLYVLKKTASYIRFVYV
jgi:hypothetical protein